MKNISTQKGATLLETLVYISILVVIMLVLISSLVILSKSYKQVTVSRTLESSALLALDRITSGIRSADSIDFANTTLDSSVGVLTVNAHATSGAAYTAKYYVTDGIVKMDINGTFEGQLTSSSTQVTSLMFRYIDTPVSDAIKVEIIIEAEVNGLMKTENFYTTTILKNSY